MTIEEKNVEIKEKIKSILEDVKPKLNEKLVENPRFDDVVTKELNYIYRRTATLDVNTEISLDKNYVTFTCGAPVIDCSLPEFAGLNKTFIKTVISLKGDDMHVEYNQGVLFDREELEKHNMKTHLKYESKLETYYALKCYTKEGIEYSNNSYADSYPLSEKMNDVILRDKISSSFYRPEFYEYSLAKIPIHVLGAQVRNTYRKKDQIEVIHNNYAIATKDGYEGVNCSLVSCSTTFPENIIGEDNIATSIETDGKYVFVVDKAFAETVEEGMKKAKENLKKALLDKNKTFNEKVYRYLLEKVQD